MPVFIKLGTDDPFVVNIEETDPEFFQLVCCRFVRFCSLDLILYKLVDKVWNEFSARGTRTDRDASQLRLVRVAVHKGTPCYIFEAGVAKTPAEPTPSLRFNDVVGI